MKQVWAVRATRSSTFVFAVAACVALAASACRSREGAKCKPGESTCNGKDSALACHDGKLEAVACRGPLGCTKVQEHASCDDSIADVGDPCMGITEEEYACSVDKKRALLCNGKKFERFLECRGTAGCNLLGQQVSCDTTVAAKGDPCKTQGASACSVDQKEMLICKDGKFAGYRFCRGQYGCYMKGESPACDETLSMEGDPCGVPGYIVCSLDKTNELVCQGGTFVRVRPCKKGCSVNTRPGGGIDCQ